MHKRFVELKNKFYHENEGGYKIPLGDSVLFYKNGICELARVRNCYRKPFKDVDELWDNYRSMIMLMAKENITSADKVNVEKSIQFIQRVDFIKHTNRIARIFFDNLAEMSVRIMIENEIFDLSKEDFINSQGNMYGKIREKEFDKHNSMKDILDSVCDLQSNWTKNNLDAQQKILQVKDFISKLSETVVYTELDVWDNLNITDIYWGNHKKVEAIISNLKNNRIPSASIPLVITQALQMYPLEKELYEEGYKVWGSEYTELRELERFMMMDEYVFDIDFFEEGFGEKTKNNIAEVEQARESSLTKREENDIVANNAVREGEKEETVTWQDKIIYAAKNFKIDAVYYIAKENEEKTVKKFNAAIQSYVGKLQEEEYPLMCYDSTFFGGGDEGCFFTTRGIYIHTNMQDGDVVFIGYEDVRKVELKGTFIKNVYVNDVEIDCSMMGGDEGKMMFRELVLLLSNPGLGQEIKVVNIGTGPVTKSFCSSCGKPVKPNVRFCSYCGNKIQ